jgi:hypothetical protein
MTTFVKVIPVGKQTPGHIQLLPTQIFYIIIAHLGSAHVPLLSQCPCIEPHSLVPRLDQLVQIVAEHVRLSQAQLLAGDLGL